jgi:hypothetical protein
MPLYALGDLEPTISPSAYVHPDAVVIGDVVVGEEASVWPTAVLRGDHGRIVIGARTSIQDGTIVHTTEQWPTVVGEDCVVGHNVHLEGCVVEDRCLVGSGSVVLNRARIERGSVVGAWRSSPRTPSCRRARWRSASRRAAVRWTATSRPAGSTSGCASTCTAGSSTGPTCGASADRSQPGATSRATTSRSTFLSILPTLVSGSSSTTSRCSGSL